MAKAKKKSAPPKKKLTVAKKKKPTIKAAAKKKIVKTAAKKVISKKSTPAKAVKPALKSSSLVRVGLHPLADRLIVQVQAGERMTAGGLYIPDTAEVSGNLKAKVLAAGNGSRNKKGQLRPLDVKAGDMVLFSQYVGSKMNIDGMEVQVLRESDILGIIEG